MEQIQKEQQDERIKRGIFKVCTGVLSITLVVMSAGTCMPLTIMAMPVVATQMSDTFEGVGDIYLGAKGDVSTRAYNKLANRIRPMFSPIEDVDIS